MVLSWGIGSYDAEKEMGLMKLNVLLVFRLLKSISNSRADTGTSPLPMRPRGERHESSYPLNGDSDTCHSIFWAPEAFERVNANHRLESLLSTKDEKPDFVYTALGPMA